MQRYFCKEKNGDKIVLYDDDYYHIHKVMRMKEEEKIEVVYNKKLYECKINNLSTNEIQIIKQLPSFINEKEINLMIPLVKEQKMDFILQKATELGVSKIIPYYCERSIVRNIDEKEEKKLIRWTKICKEASEQSKRLTIPIITKVKKINDLNFEGVKLVCSTYEKSQNLKLFLKTQKLYDKINIVVGPEGGLTIKEEQQFNNMGYKSITLGNNILRVETVPIFILSVLNYETME